MSNNGKGAVLLSASDFSHTPTQPDDMSDEFYASAIYGTNLPSNTGYSPSGNISAGSFFTSSIKSFIGDTSNLVLNSVGHRLSLINPKALGTSFGYSRGDSSSKTSGKYYQYTTVTMYAKSSNASTGKFYTWPPAGYCPIEVTERNELWSISLDNNYKVSYSGSCVKSDAMTITLSCDGKSYVVDSDIFYSSYYNAIYFALPSELKSSIYSAGKNVTVDIKGGITNITTSEETNINYSIEFYSAEPIPVTGLRIYGKDIEDTSETYWSLRSCAGYIGGGKKLLINYEPSNTTEKEIEVSFSNPNIASYNYQTDTINYIGAGTTTCTIKSKENSNISYNIEITVYNKIESIHLEKYNYTIDKGKTAQAKVIYSPSDNLKLDDKEVTYEIKDTNIATVDSNGLITAKNAGTTTITIKNASGLEYTSNIKVVIPVEKISFDKNIYEAMLGEDISCSIIVTPEDATSKENYIYSYNEDELICYKNTNKIKGLKSGEYDVKVALEGKEGSAKVRIYEPMKSFELQEKNVEIYINQRYSPTLINILPSGEYTKSEYILETLNSNIAKIDNGKVVGVNKGSTTIKVKSKYDDKIYQTFSVVVKEEESYASVEYTTHVQNIGWQKYVKNGEMAGTSGLSLRLEGIKIKINSNLDGNVEYSTHIQNIGWQDYKLNDEMSGISGLGLRLEAIKIRLTDKLAENFDIYYRVHVQNVGWLDWAKNGEESGTSGLGLRLEGIKIRLKNQCISGNVEYSTHIQNIGWQDYKSNDEMSGTSGKGLRLEAIKIRLTDELAEKFDIYYRVHAQNAGWLGWAKNGEESGTSGYGFRLEGIEIKIVEKGAEAPGSTENCFVQLLK